MVHLLCLLFGSCAAFAPHMPRALARSQLSDAVGIARSQHAVRTKTIVQASATTVDSPTTDAPAVAPATDGPEESIPGRIGSVAPSDLTRQYDLLVVGGGPCERGSF